MKKGKRRGSRVMPSTSYEWETVATNLDEFVDVTVSPTGSLFSPPFGGPF